jgi:hypothetical protein
MKIEKDTASRIKEISKMLKNIVGTVPTGSFFNTSNGELIDLRIKKNENDHNKINSIEKQKLTLKDLFCNENDIQRCLQVLRDLEKPFITADNKYIGNNKGMFPLWINVLKNQKPKSLINILTDEAVKDILNDSIEGLKLSKDASEFRKTYSRLENSGVRMEIKTLLASR